MGISTIRFPAYKAFVRELHKIYQEYKDNKENLEKKIELIEAKWIKQGCNPEILKKIKAIVSAPNERDT